MIEKDKPNMTATRFISAIGTPLDEDGALHVPGLEAHMEDQWQAGIDGLLVAGTMGMMQMQTDETYRRLVEEAANLASGRGEVMIGVGDASFARTRDRIKFVNRHRVDAVVVLTPYFIPFTQEDLVDYFLALADFSRHPLYLYDLPVMTGVKLEMETVLRVAEHPNIHGIKCSCEWDWTRQLIERIGDRFRVIVAQPLKVDRLIREGVGEHLDGIFTAAPAWTVQLGRAADAGDWSTAAAFQQRITQLLEVYGQFGGMPSYSAILNARGIPGNFAPAPYRPLSESRREQLLDHPLVRELVADSFRPEYSPP